MDFHLAVEAARMELRLSNGFGQRTFDRPSHALDDFQARVANLPQPQDEQYVLPDIRDYLFVLLRYLRQSKINCRHRLFMQPCILHDLAKHGCSLAPASPSQWPSPLQKSKDIPAKKLVPRDYKFIVPQILEL